MISHVAQDDLEAELLESPERERIGPTRGRRDFGTCQVGQVWYSTATLGIATLLFVKYQYSTE
jgi:hypothetical protein